MRDEYTDRHHAIQRRLAGQSMAQICRALGRTDCWFRKWWGRYLEFGPDGLFDLTHATHQVARRIPPELERTTLTIRRRLEGRMQPRAHYQLIGASAILAELKALHTRSSPLPSLRITPAPTAEQVRVERTLQRNGITLPRVRLARWLPRHSYPSPQAHGSNELHQLDFVGPLYLKGKRQRFYILVGKDVFDGAVCLKLSRSRKMEQVLAFLGDCWKLLGRPAQLQFDNARELVSWGSEHEQPGCQCWRRVIDPQSGAVVSGQQGCVEFAQDITGEYRVIGR
ncbi:MAG: helix-turn-helix domain-containing protein, partial [Anaerolineales bacterium]|nr:helix-turn-helix domain-containing protein [Anaerolineales bacterium]